MREPVQLNGFRLPSQNQLRKLIGTLTLQDFRQDSNKLILSGKLTFPESLKCLHAKLNLNFFSQIFFGFLDYKILLIVGIYPKFERMMSHHPLSDDQLGNFFNFFPFNGNIIADRFTQSGMN